MDDFVILANLDHGIVPTSGSKGGPGIFSLVFKQPIQSEKRQSCKLGLFNGSYRSTVPFMDSYKILQSPSSPETSPRCF